jgi:hypothetical protein
MILAFSRVTGTGLHKGFEDFQRNRGSNLVTRRDEKIWPLKEIEETEFRDDGVCSMEIKIE